LSATGSSNGNENTPGAHPGGKHSDHLLDALLRARRTGSAPASSGISPGAGSPTGPASPTDYTGAPLRSRSGGVNTPRAVVPTAVLAAEAARLADSAHGKRARMMTAIGVPAVFLAASGVAVMPTVANAASSSSPAKAATTSCPPGSSTVADGAAKTTTPATPPSSAPSSSGKPSSAPSTANTPGAPQPSTSPSAPTSPKQDPPIAGPTGAPSGTTAPKQAPTSAPTAPAPSSKTSAPTSAPSTTPSPTSTATWWDPLTWLGTTVNGVFNPAPATTSSPANSTVNKLAVAPAANPSSNPTSSPTPLLSLNLGGSSSSPSAPPPSKPTSAPTTTLPSTPQPTSSTSSKPSTAGSSTGSAPSSASSSSSTPSDGTTTVTVGGHAVAVPTAPTAACVTPAAPTALREVEWHLDASSLTLNNQKFLGFQDIQTGDGRTVTVMAIHADSVQLTDMVTYNEDGNPRVYSNGGKGKTVTLTNVTLHVLQQKGDMVSPLPLGAVTLGPPGEAGTDVTSQLVMGLLQLNLPLPIPSIFTNVHVDQYTLTSDTLDVPGFNVTAPAS